MLDIVHIFCLYTSLPAYLAAELFCNDLFTRSYFLVVPGLELSVGA